MKFTDFKEMIDISIEDICRKFYNANRDLIRIKKENTAVKNLVCICNATLKLSNEQGFHSMSLRDLSRESGLSMGGLYSYISSKGELLQMIHKHGFDSVKEILLVQLNKKNHPAEKLHTAIEMHIYLSEIMNYWFYFFFMETKNLSKEEQKMPVKSELWTEKLFVDILNEGKEQKIFDITDTTLTGSAIKALMQDWYLKRWKYSRRKISVEDYARFVIDFVDAFIMKKKGQG